MTIALVTLGLVVVVLLAERWQDHRHQRELIALIDRLCQRVQAPHAAVLEHDEQVREPRSEEYAPPAVEPDDDEAFWTSRDRLADLMMAQEVNGGRAD